MPSSLTRRAQRISPFHPDPFFGYGLVSSQYGDSPSLSIGNLVTAEAEIPSNRLACPLLSRQKELLGSQATGLNPELRFIFTPTPPAYPIEAAISKGCSKHILTYIQGASIMSSSRLPRSLEFLRIILPVSHRKYLSQRHHGNARLQPCWTEPALFSMG